MMQSEDVRMALCRGRVHERWEERRRQITSAVTEIIRRGADEGKVRTDVPPQVMAAFLLGMLRTLARDLEDEPDSIRRPELVVELFMRGAGHADASVTTRAG